MQAFGDLMLFLAMFGTLSLVPTGLALYFVRKSKVFWTLFSIVALVFAATGPIAAARVPHDTSMLMFFGLPRVLGAPLFCFAFLIAAVLVPRDPDRPFPQSIRGGGWTLLASSALEALTSAYAYFCLFVLGRWLV